MNCPICGREMLPGGLISDGVYVSWVPESEFEKKGIARLAYYGGKTLGSTNFVLKQTRVPGAYYCKGCNKVAGIFDVTSEN